MAAGVEEVYGRFDDDLRRFVRARVADPDAVEDIVQDVYLKIHSRIDTLEDRQKVRAWIYRITRNAVADHYRSLRPSADLAQAPAADPALEDPPGDDLEGELLRTVNVMLEALPPGDREALQRTEYEGLSQKELADRLGISVSGAKSRVQRARMKLKALLLDCCHFELDRRGRVIDYYEHGSAPDDRGRRPR